MPGLWLQAAESGNLEDFARLLLADPRRLTVRDSRGRAAVHQAASRNRINILQFIVAHDGGERTNENTRLPPDAGLIGG